ncbi:YqaA family protein [Marinomonas ostreistagni]|uniref:DedA family protein n=1 Tax=Marinomonas ostreistagni TaxID=359209 RepID=A0ABS0ZC63_9GAMM|nr:YqaA family protein [Marinomonas ostreistagni]MBJ7551246.1 DedA family protein [Marinomonas ostreistagni]
MFLFSFLAATLLPGGSEVLLIGLVGKTPDYSLLLWFFASIGNTLGGMTNWWLGRYFLRFQGHRFFPISKEQLSRVQTWVSRYGMPILVLSWLPVVGDAICLAAGVAKLNGFATAFWIFIGKSLRYAVLVWGTSALVIS